jgi:two-component system, OmpR family, sensor histidine kinase KdpD
MDPALPIPDRDAEPVGSTPPGHRADGARRRGRLRVYLGAAPGAGKTFAMLREGRERVTQGEDVVIGFVETYGRPRTIEAIGRLEVVPRLQVPYRGSLLGEMDTDAVLARHPQVALVDELAHTNAPGVRHPKRWQDVEVLRDAGIDVVSTMNVQHLESVKDLVEGITGIPVGETVPDEVLDGADEIQFIDITPDALRKRMRHGNVYAAEQVDTALRNFFRSGNLAALREIALRLVAQGAGAARSAVRPPPQDVLVMISGRPSSEVLIRRGARIARRLGGLCSVLTVVGSADGATDAERWRALAAQLHCSFIERRSGDVPGTVVGVARALGVRHVVVGESATERFLDRWRAGLVDRLIDDPRDTDVHVIARIRRGWPRTAHLGTPRPSPDDLLRGTSPPGRRGSLRVYLGYARGVGTTSAMLDEGRRRQGRGADVVVAAVDTARRPGSRTVLAGLELLGGPEGTGVHDRLDVDALLARNPEVALIDDLAGLDVEGCPRADSVPRILDAGITVIATLHLTSLTSMARAMESVLGDHPAGPPVDDGVLGLADELELVDVTPAGLDERLRRGEVVPPAEAARALQGEFRPDVLATLREATFRLIAEHTDRQLVTYMHDRRIDRPWEARSRVMVCVPPRPHMESLIRRAARLADSLDAEMRVVTVRTRRHSLPEKELLGEYASLTHQLGGEFMTLYGRAPAPAVAAYARQTLATEILLTRGGGEGHWRRNTLHRLVRMLADVDIHVLANELDAQTSAAERLNARRLRGRPLPSGGDGGTLG